MTAVAVEVQSSCAIDGAGDAWCWGTNCKGGIGDGTTTDRPTPTKVLGLPKRVNQVQPGYGNTCAVLEDATVWCWGNNQYGELGDGTTVDRVVPTPVAGLSGVEEVATSNQTTCARSAEAVWCWGSNFSPTPAPVAISCP